jgi:hypothetical protein
LAEKNAGGFMRRTALLASLAALAALRATLKIVICIAALTIAHLRDFFSSSNPKVKTSENLPAAWVNKI